MVVPNKSTSTLSKAIVELEEMYSGIPDESVDLTFQHLANLKQNNPNNSQDHHHHHNHIHQNKPTNNNNMETISAPENSLSTAKHSSPTVVIKDEEITNHIITPLRKMPSLDFTKGLEATNLHHQPHQYQYGRISQDGLVNHPFKDSNNNHDHYDHTHDHHGMSSHYSCVAHSGFRQGVEEISASYGMGGHSMIDDAMSQRAPAGRRRPGIPHSKICAVCSTHTYLVRHRCLVCGRVYCRQCVKIGMGEMTEGRKCIECLGRKFSQRYIQRAGEAGCFCSRYPSVVRQAELKWAEKGPRRNGDRAYGRSEMMSRSRSPMGSRTPTGAHASIEPNSFVTSSSYSPYTPTHHHFPF